MSPTHSATQYTSLRGPLTTTTSPEWRRRRLLGIGTDSRDSFRRTRTLSGDEEAPLIPDDDMMASYGSLPMPRSRTRTKGSLNGASPSTHREPSIGPEPYSPVLSRIRSQSSVFFDRFRRPLSAYDAGAAFDNTIDVPGEEGARVNGVRVWYSSFTSIDWLHDAIKDSARMLQLRRKRRSFRGRVRNFVDRSMGWLIVTIVGFLTAIIAFLIIRSEQLLFDFKEGYCATSVFKAKRFCCAASSDTSVPFQTYVTFEDDDSWEEGWALEYISYTVIALALAITSSILTIRLTASTRFITRKESGFGPSYSLDTKNVESPVDGARKRKVLYFASGSGIPEIKTILSGFVIHGYLGSLTLFTKSVGLALSVASGLSLGKEGPFVHIASCVGNIVSRYFRKYENNEGKRREILSAAAAAGVAVAFGAPIGGVLFSLEEVSYFFPPKVMWRSFWCAMIAAVTLKFLDPFGTGKLVLFQVTYDKDWHAYELVPFLLLGVFGGVYGAYFSKLNYRWSRYVRNGTWLKTHPVSEVVLVTLITSALGFLNLYTRMGGTELVYNLFAECRAGDSHEGLCLLPDESPGPIVSAIALALIVKGGLTIITFGIKLPAGIFIPSLGVGACMGRIVGIGMQHLQQTHPHWPMFDVCRGDLNCIVPGVYAMVGAAGSLSGVTRTTVSLAVIMFELTNSLAYVVPIMLSVLVAKTVADALEPKGIYDLVIELSQLPYLDHKQEYLWGAYQVLDITDKTLDAIRCDIPNTVRTLSDKLRDAASSGVIEGFPLITGEGKVVGYIGINELEHALAIVADEPDMECTFHAARRYHPAGFDAESATTSVVEAGLDFRSPFDFTIYMDQAPLTIQAHAPLELVQQMFVKLGAKYIIVTDPDGLYVGVIDKKSWIAFLGELEEKAK
ncbi:hypothetical protein FRB99_001690 [Tulasnella sp. 403]|nr:hypothetical protein FRB99_001690 [Tulasnella sp. 403]